MFQESYFYKTDLGEYHLGKAETLLNSELGDKFKGKIQLILTSPPFPLNNKKSYGNLKGEEYKTWLVSFAEIFSDLLTDNGSIVIELGNAWEPNRPIQSLLPLEALLGFVKNSNANLRLCQQFVCHNPARLPSPVQWVNIERCRTTDSFTNIWWMSKSDYPKADNRNILRPYSKWMKELLKKQKYNPGKRPSEHNIGEKSFLKDNKGSIVHNFIDTQKNKGKKNPGLPKNVFSIANTKSNNFFMRACRDKNIKVHPARMQMDLANFFIQFLTDPGDIVLDPFGGSNTTGFCAELLNRKWISIEVNKDYAMQSMLRFEDPRIKVNLFINEREEIK